MATRQAKDADQAAQPKGRAARKHSSTRGRTTKQVTSGRFQEKGERSGITQVKGGPLAAARQAGSATPTATAVFISGPGPSEIWQARVSHEFSAKLLEDAELLGLDSKTDVVKAALELLHRQAAEVRMAEGVRDYYGNEAPPLPAGVVPFDPSEIEDDE